MESYKPQGSTIQEDMFSDKADATYTPPSTSNVVANAKMPSGTTLGTDTKLKTPAPYTTLTTSTIKSPGPFVDPNPSTPTGNSHVDPMISSEGSHAYQSARNAVVTLVKYLNTMSNADLEKKTGIKGKTIESFLNSLAARATFGTTKYTDSKLKEYVQNYNHFKNDISQQDIKDIIDTWTRSYRPEKTTTSSSSNSIFISDSSSSSNSSSNSNSSVTTLNEVTRIIDIALRNSASFIKTKYGFASNQKMLDAVYNQKTINPLSSAPTAIKTTLSNYNKHKNDYTKD